MNKINITNFKQAHRIKALHDKFGGELTIDCEEYKVRFDNGIGQGFISGIDYENGVSVSMFDLKLNQDIELIHNLGNRHPILFEFTEQGAVTLVSTQDELDEKLEKNEAAIFSPRGDYPYSIVLEKGMHIRSVIVGVVRYLFLDKVECEIDTFPNTIEDMFKDTRGEHRFFFKTIPEPHVVESITRIIKNESPGLERKLLIESNALRLITILVKNFRQESKVNDSAYRFSNRDMEKVNEVKNHIIKNIDKQIKVKELAHLAGMNSTKLQKGFHLLFGKSIKQFAISLKMHRALLLLEENSYSIGEIANEVGYTNKGHFSELFEREFGILPSHYVDNFISRNGSNGN